MKSPLARTPDRAASAGAGAVACFLRFAVLGGGTGVLAGLAAPLLATVTPWVVANAVVTAASTALSTELHSRVTFAQGRGAGWRGHAQSAGSAAVAYLVTCTAVGILHLLDPSPSVPAEQFVHLGASGLAGIGRFLVLRHCVFTARNTPAPRAAEPLTPALHRPSLNAPFTI